MTYKLVKAGDKMSLYDKANETANYIKSKIKNIPYVFVKKFCIVMVSKILFLLNTTKGTKKNKGGQYELQKVYSSYDKLKDSYREILTEDDIRECFQNDDIKTEMKRTIDRSVRIYLIIWGGILLSLLILVEYMSSEPFIWPILKSLFQITKK